MSFRLHRVAMVALLMGSAILLFSCKEDGGEAEQSLDTIKTEESENLKIRMSENGRTSYLFKTKLLEGYTLGRDPYREFRKGIEITTFQDDSLSTENTHLVANYAIYYEKRKLWEARGDVVVTKAGGNRRLYTQQLFWNSVTKRIYSNVDTKLVTWWYNDKGELVVEDIIGEGFESDEDMNEPRFRRWQARMYVDPEKIQEEDQKGEDVKVEPNDKKEEKPVQESLKESEPTKPAPKEKPKKPAPKPNGANKNANSVKKPAPASGRPDNPFIKPNASGEKGNPMAQRRNIGSSPSQKKK